MLGLRRLSVPLLRPCCAIVTFLIFLSISAAGQASKGCGQAVNGLQLCLTRVSDQTSLTTSLSPKRFRIQFRSTGTKDLMLNIGVMLGNREKYPSRVQFAATDSDGREIELNGGPLSIHGTLKPWGVTLHAGSSFSLTVNLQQYLPQLQQGTYSLRAQYKERGVREADAKPGINLRSGSVLSAEVSFSVPVG